MCALLEGSFRQCGVTPFDLLQFHVVHPGVPATLTTRVVFVSDGLCCSVCFSHLDVLKYVLASSAFHARVSVMLSCGNVGVSWTSMLMVAFHVLCSYVFFFLMNAREQGIS